MLKVARYRQSNRNIEVVMNLKKAMGVFDVVRMAEGVTT
jgi:hypothetical protein